jgi:predicted HTH domain antitoxin
MQWTLTIPDDQTSALQAVYGTDLSRAALELFALDLFRKEKVTVYEFGKILGMNRLQADAYLNEKKEYAQSLTPEDLENDFQTGMQILRELGR